MKLAVNLALSLAMLALCLWFVWPDPGQAAKLGAAFTALQWSRVAPYLAAYIGLLAVVHVCRALRWNNLLHPIGVTLEPMRLLAISSVGFMAVLALPARLGEFVRPALIRKKGEVSAAAALGTIAVERIGDGLMVSLLVFAALFALRGPTSPSWMMPTAYAALGIFSAASVFLWFALRKPQATVAFATRVFLLRRLMPRAAESIERNLLKLISGFTVLTDRRNLARFALWSTAYWAANGLSLYVLALGFGLGLSLVGAFATMGLVAVGIILPNAPGLVGQYQAFTLLGLTLYLPPSTIEGKGLAFAIALHGLQVVWYVGLGALALASPYVSFSEAFTAQPPEPPP
jgi:glycosyltransferase 2 family protein